MQKSSLKNAAILTAISAALFTSPSAKAASGTWNGTTDALWATTTNWSATPVPGTGDTATFSGAGNSNVVLNLGAGVTVNTILFDTSSAAAYTIGSGAVNSQTLTLDNGGAVTLNSGVANNQLFNAALVLGNDGSTQTFTLTNNSATNSLTVAGTVTGSTGAGVKTLAVAGSGSVTISGVIANGTTGTAALTKSGAGTLTLSGVNTFTGGTTISGGTVNITQNANLGSVTVGQAPVTLNGGTLNAMNGVTNTHVITIGASGGTINVGGNATQQFYFHTASTLTGSGTLTITGGNIGNGNDVRIDTAQTGYTGNIILSNGGILEYGVANAVNSTATFNVNSGGELTVNNTLSLPNTITMANGGTLSFNGGGTFSGGTITLGTGTETVALRNYFGFNTPSSGTISGKLTSVGGLLVNSGGGSGATLTLTGANDYTGATTANNSNVTVSGATGTISGSSGITMNGGTLALDNTAGSVNRVKDTANVTLVSNAGLTLTGNGATTSTTETIGTLGIGSGNQIVTITGAGTGQLQTLAASGFSRTNNGTALIRGTSLQAGATFATRVTINGTSGTGLDFVGAGTSSVGTSTIGTDTTLRIVPYLIGSTSATGNGSSFLTYDTAAAGGLRLLGAGEYTTLAAGYTTPGTVENVKAASVTISTASNVTVNSLLFGTATQTLTGSGGALIVNSGAVAVAENLGAEVIGNGFSGLTLGNGTWNEGVITTAGTGALTINTAIGVTGSGGLTKAGAGTLTLGAVNTYSGQTTVNQGTLAVTAGVNNVLNGTTGTALQVQNGATFNTNASTQKITTLGLTGNATVSGTGGVLDLGGTVTYDTSTNPGPGATISVATLDLNGTRAFEIGGAPYQWNPAIYNTTGSKQLTISSAIVNGTGTGGITKNGAGVLVLSGAGTSNTYSGTTTVNAGTLYFLASAAGAPNSDITVNSGATLAAQLSNGTSSGSNGTSPVTTIGKSLTLNGANVMMGTNDNPNSGSGRALRYNFTNALTVASGASTVSINRTANGGFGSNIEFGSLSRTAGATVLFRGSNLGSGALRNNSGNDGIVFNTAPTTTLTNGVQLVGGNGAIGTTTTNILSFAIGDSGNYANTFLLTSGLGTDFVTYNGGSVQLLTTYASTITSGASALNNVKITDTSVGGINAATTINSLILNSATATVGDAGASTLDGTGTLTLNSGAIMVTTTSAANANGGSNSNYGGLYTNNATIGTSGLTLAFGAKEAILTTVGSSSLTLASTSGGITGTAGLTKSGAGNLNLNAADTFTGITTINAGKIVLGNANALQNTTLNYDNQGGSLSFGTLTAATLGSLKGAQDLALNNVTPAAVAMSVGNNNAASDTYSGVLSGTGSVIKVGTGTQILTGLNSYSGSTTINAGILQVSKLANGGSNSGIGSSGTAVGTGSVATDLVIDGGTLLYTGSGDNTNRLFTVGISGGTIDNSSASNGALNFTGTGSLVASSNANRTLTLTGSSTGTSSISSVITDSAGGLGTTGLTKSGAGYWQLFGTNTYTGATAVNNGTLRVTAAGSINTSSAITVGVAGVFQYDGTTAAGNVTVNTGGTLKGLGYLGNVTVNGGTIAPGDSPGIINTGNFSIATGTLAAEINSTTVGQYDMVDVTGSVTLGGNLTVALSGYTYNFGDLFFIINNDSTDAVSGLLNGAAQGSLLTLSGQDFLISYTGSFGSNTFAGTGNDVVLQAIPEPSTWGMLAASLGLFFVVNRGRRTKS